MKGDIQITKLIHKSSGNVKELRLLYNLIKNHSHFVGERRKLYKLIVKYKNNKGGR